MDAKYDSAFMSILVEEKNITSFLDKLFGFLYRCTDFFMTTNSTSFRLGYPEGVAQELLCYSFQKWQSMKSIDEKSTEIDNLISYDKAYSASNNNLFDSTNRKAQIEKTKQNQPRTWSSCSLKNSSDSYNGQSFENYRWSQTINDLDVVVVVPGEILSSKQLRVTFLADMIEVAMVRPTRHNKKMIEWKIIVRGELAHKIKTSECFWYLEPGKYVSLHLQKQGERWWESLLVNEPRLELSKIDCSKDFEDLGEREQMKVQELIWNQHNKLRNESTASARAINNPNATWRNVESNGQTLLGAGSSSRAIVRSPSRNSSRSRVPDGT